MSNGMADDRCCASEDTSCGFIDFTSVLLFKIYLRFRGIFLRFHNTAMFVSDRRWPQLGWPARGPWCYLGNVNAMCYTEAMIVF